MTDETLAEVQHFRDLIFIMENMPNRGVHYPTEAVFQNHFVDFMAFIDPASAAALAYAVAVLGCSPVIPDAKAAAAIKKAMEELALAKTTLSVTEQKLDEMEQKVQHYRDELAVANYRDDMGR